MESKYIIGIDPGNDASHGTACILNTGGIIKYHSYYIFNSRIERAKFRMEVVKLYMLSLGRIKIVKEV